jgi:heme/copper-type cytochrome/quinol oxidase subunit 2
MSTIGEIVAFYTDTKSVIHGFTRTSSGLQSVGFPGATHTFALRISNPGLLVGDYVDATGTTHGFVAVLTATSTRDGDRQI